MAKTTKKTAAKTAKSKSASASSDRELKLLPKELLLRMHSEMVKSRVLEERLIKIYKSGESYF